MPRGPQDEKRPVDVIGAMIGNVEAHPLVQHRTPPRAQIARQQRRWLH